MPKIHRRIDTTTAPEAVFAYLSDFTTATEWDSGTQSCKLIQGDGGPGSVYRNVSSFMGRRVTLDYTVEQVAAPVFVIVGRSGTTTSRDTITVTPRSSAGSSAGSTVDYLAQFEFTGLTRLLAPLLKPALNRLGDETERTLGDALERL